MTITRLYNHFAPEIFITTKISRFYFQIILKYVAQLKKFTGCKTILNPDFIVFMTIFGTILILYNYNANVNEKKFANKL